MGILDKLKKEKKEESVLDALVKKKSDKEEPDDVVHESSSDVEVRELRAASKPPSSEADEISEISDFEKPIREFRTSGMHEFELDSLGADGDANIKVEYKVRIGTLIDQGKIDEAMRLLEELKVKLAEKKE
jgi:hypothetical protein